MQTMPSWLVSMVFHMIVLVGLALYWLPAEAVDELRQLVIAASEDRPLEELEPLADELLPEIDLEIAAEPVEVVSEVEQEGVSVMVGPFYSCAMGLSM